MGFLNPQTADHVCGRILSGTRPGRKPAIPLKIEKEIVQQELKAGEKGFGVTKKQLRLKTTHVVKKLKLKTPFEKEIPGKKWFEGLKKRHSEISVSRPQPLSVVRSRMLNPMVCSKYFLDVQKELTNLGLLDKPAQVWNCYESNIQLEHKPSAVISQKGNKSQCYVHIK